MLPSGTVTFLFTDVEGSTALWEAKPEEMEIALKGHNEAIERVAAEFSGHVFKTIGDAYCIAFGSAEHAADAALAAQAALARTKHPLNVRMALNTGAIQPTGNDYFGPPLNRVARLLSAAHGSQILMSDATKSLLPNRFPLKDLGSHGLRDLMEATRIWQLGAGDYGAVRSLTAIPNNLPLQTTSFIGRVEEMEQLTAMLPKSRMITLTGTGGTGKSRLSLQFAAEHMDQFPDGVWFCELAALPDREDVLRALVTAIGAPDVAGISMRDRLVMHLAGKTALLIVDNCEHVLDAASKIVEDVMGACPSVVIIATSREPLGVRGEAAFRVPSLPSPDPAKKVSLDDLDRFGSTALFMDRLATAAPSYELQAQEAATVAHICTRLDGIPLAIELAAARGRAMSLDQIEKRLNDRFRLLTGGSRNALSRQQTLRALIDWSVQLLDDRERKFLFALSVFGGGWDVEAAENICSGEEMGLEAWQVIDFMTTLVDKSLVVFERATDRYRLLESIRQYALEQLEHDPVALILRDKHAAYYLKLSENMVGSVASHGRFLSDYENFRMAVEWTAGMEGGRDVALRALCLALSGFHSLCRLPEFVRLVEGIQIGEQGDCDTEVWVNGKILCMVARVLYGDPKGVETALTMKKELDTVDPAMKGQWRSAICHALFHSRRFDEAIAFVDETLAMNTAAELGLWHRYLNVHRGNSLTALHRYDEALASLQIAQDLLEEAEDERGSIANLANFTALHLARGNMADAIRTGLEINRRSTKSRVYVTTRGFTLLALGHRAMDLGDQALAAIFLGGNFAIREAGGIVNDPVDEMAEQSLVFRVNEALPEEERRAAISRGRAVDWEPWFVAMLPMTAEEVLSSKQIPHVDLIRS
jgi:predicted ATPase/class 3 adenylate cyclase